MHCSFFRLHITSLHVSSSLASALFHPSTSRWQEIAVVTALLRKHIFESASYNRSIQKRHFMNNSVLYCDQCLVLYEGKPGVLQVLCLLMGILCLLYQTLRRAPAALQTPLPTPPLPCHHITCQLSAAPQQRQHKSRDQTRTCQAAPWRGCHCLQLLRQMIRSIQHSVGCLYSTLCRPQTRPYCSPCLPEATQLMCSQGNGRVCRHACHLHQL